MESKRKEEEKINGNRSVTKRQQIYKALVVISRNRLKRIFRVMVKNYLKNNDQKIYEK